MIEKIDGVWRVKFPEKKENETYDDYMKRYNYYQKKVNFYNDINGFFDKLAYMILVVIFMAAMSGLFIFTIYLCIHAPLYGLSIILTLAVLSIIWLVLRNFYYLWGYNETLWNNANP